MAPVIVAVSGHYGLPGQPSAGIVRFVPAVYRVSTSDNVMVPATPESVQLDSNGDFTINLQATDDPSYQPSGWTYRVEAILNNGLQKPYNIHVPASAVGTGLNLADVIPIPSAFGDVTLVPGPPGPDGPVGPPGPTNGTTVWNLNAGRGVMTQLNHGNSVVMQLLGDSTGDAADEWFGLLGLALADRGSRNVWWQQWNDATQTYNSPVPAAMTHNGDRFVNFSNGSMIYTAPSVTGDLEVIARLKPNNWRPGAGIQTIASKYEDNPSAGWDFSILPDGTLRFNASPDGVNIATALSSVLVPFTGNTTASVRVTFVASTGIATFYTSVNYGISWTQLGAPFAMGVNGIFNNSAVPYMAGAVLVSGANAVNPFLGGIEFLEIRNGINGTAVAPILLEKWDQRNTVVVNGITYVGDPMILLMSGSQASQNIAYFDNGTRRPKLLAPNGQDIMFLSTGHNDTPEATNAAWIASYSTWVNNIKTGRPGVVIVPVTQNPEFVPAFPNNIFGLTQNRINNHAARGGSLMSWTASQAGVYGIDTFPAFAEDYLSKMQSDGVHPNALGEQAWADYVDQALFLAEG